MAPSNGGLRFTCNHPAAQAPMPWIQKQAGRRATMMSSLDSARIDVGRNFHRRGAGSIQARLADREAGGGGGGGDRREEDGAEDA